MKQAVIRDPGSESPIRVWDSGAETIVNGSVLIVPEGAVAFAIINGTLINEKLNPGRYAIDTDESPFFVNLRHYMTNGDSYTSVKIFFVSTKKEFTATIGTDKILVKEQRHKLDIHVIGAISFIYRISDPLKFITNLSGLDHDQQEEDQLMEFFRHFISERIRTSISEALLSEPLEIVNAQLESISSKVKKNSQKDFNDSGLELVSAKLLRLDILDEDKQMLNDIGQKYVNGRIDIELKKEELDSIYNGDVNKKMLVDVAKNGDGQQGGGNMMSAFAQIYMMQQFMPTMMSAIPSMNSPAAESVAFTDTVRQCDCCRSMVLSTVRKCPICGTDLKKE